MKWCPQDYYTCEPIDFHLACEGYYAGLEDSESMFRNLAIITYKSMGGKDDISHVWKLKRDAKNIDAKPFTPEEIEKITARANLIFSKKNARAKSKSNS